jgi:hypothetical protein
VKSVKSDEIAKNHDFDTDFTISTTFNGPAKNMLSAMP